MKHLCELFTEDQFYNGTNTGLPTVESVFVCNPSNLTKIRHRKTSILQVALVLKSFSVCHHYGSYPTAEQLHKIAKVYFRQCHVFLTLATATNCFLHNYWPVCSIENLRQFVKHISLLCAYSWEWWFRAFALAVTRQGLILSRVIPKTSKMVSEAALAKRSASKSSTKSKVSTEQCYYN